MLSCLKKVLGRLFFFRCYQFTLITLKLHYAEFCLHNFSLQLIFILHFVFINIFFMERLLIKLKKN